jgi:hypothetical protein
MRKILLALALVTTGVSLGGCWHHDHDHPGSWGDHGSHHGGHDHDHGGYDH